MPFGEGAPDYAESAGPNPPGAYAPERGIGADRWRAMNVPSEMVVALMVILSASRGVHACRRTEHPEEPPGLRAGGDGGASVVSSHLSCCWRRCGGSTWIRPMPAETMSEKLTRV